MPDDEMWTVSRSGVELVIGWCRFQLQICELTHSGRDWWDAHENGDAPNEDDHDTHRVAFLMFVLLIPWAQYFGIPLEIEEEGHGNDEEAGRQEAGEGNEEADDEEGFRIRFTDDDEEGYEA